MRERIGFSPLSSLGAAIAECMSAHFTSDVFGFFLSFLASEAFKKSLPWISSSNLGHWLLGFWRKSDPSIQDFRSYGLIPVVRASAGLLFDLMHWKSSTSTVSWISATLADTKGLNFLGGVLGQESTVAESTQKVLLHSMIFAKSSAFVQVSVG